MTSLAVEHTGSLPQQIVEGRYCNWINRSMENVRRISKSFGGFALLLWLTLAARPAGSQALRLAQPNAARFPEVTLYAYPTDARGALVGDLQAGAFRVTENGLPARVTRVEARTGFLDVCLVLDCSHSMAVDRRLDLAKGAAREFVQALGPQDRAALVTFATTSRLDQGLTGDRGALLGAVDRAQLTGASTAFLDSVYWGITQVALRPETGGVLSAAPTRTRARADARRVVLALTDGADNASRTFPQHLIEYARANGVSLVMVALGDEATPWQMRQLAGETGGRYLEAAAPEDLRRLYSTLAGELRQEYRVVFQTPEPKKDSQRREVSVEVSGSPGGRAWYQAPGQGSLLVTAAPEEEAAAGVSGATGSGGGIAPGMLWGALLAVAGLGAAVAAYFFRIGAQGRPAERGTPMSGSNPRMDLLPLWVREGSTRVGRGRECELVLDSRQVSRVHARIDVENGLFELVDAGSRNGTYVNGKRVKRTRALQIGDVIRFGDREFRFAGLLGD